MDTKKALEPGQPFEVSSPPNWHLNPKTNCHADSTKPWWKISDFDKALGDIKCVWEASRFDWVLHFAQAYLLGEEDALTQLNTWLYDWQEKNPAYYGANWKCGQEAGIRILHLAMGAVLLEQVNASEMLLNLIEQHVKRIMPTLHYAMSQDNNHGTSEAAALFIAGSWLAHNGRKKGKRWEKIGRRWLENRVARLVGADGSFSQYSVNYHRVFLDTLCMVEIWRTLLELPRFSAQYYQKAIAATHWLFSMVDTCTGDAPNLGAHDGARLLSLVPCASRDFRPTVQTAAVLFTGKSAYEPVGHWNDVLHWFHIPVPNQQIEASKSVLHDAGGFAVLRRGQIMAMLRYPRFKFRPSQADVLHLDLWKDGENVLRDAGTYGYNVEQKWLNYFSGTKAHNTIEFDDRDQMPRLGRFLFGDWVKTKSRTALESIGQEINFAAAYQDNQGCMHQREVKLSPHALMVRDSIYGFRHKAVLRWRLAPGEWRLEHQSVIGPKGKLSISAHMPIKKICLVQGYESRYYLKKDKVPVLEVEVDEAGELTSEYEWTQ